MCHSSFCRSHGGATVLTNLCVIVCLDGAQKFTPAQEQQLVRSDPRDRPLCQHKQKQVHRSFLSEEIQPESFGVCLASC